MHKAFVLAGAGAVLVTLAACGPSHNTTSTPHASVTQRVQCAVQMDQWGKKDNLKALLTQVTTDIRTLPSGSAAGDRAALRQTTHSLVTDVTAFQKNPPPTCVPGFASQFNAGLTQLLNADAASHSTNPASAQQVSGDLQAAGTFLRQASKDAAHFAVTGK